MKKLPQGIVTISFASLFTDIAGEAVFSVLPFFLTIQLGATPFSLGLIEGIADGTASLLKYFSGRLSDKLGKRKTLVFSGYFLAALTKPLIGFVGNWGEVLALRFIDRTGKGIRGAPRDAWLTSIVEDKKDLARAFGFHRAMDHAGAVLGPLIATAYLASTEDNYRGLFLWMIIPGLLASFFIYRTKETIGEVKANQLPALRDSLKNLSPTLKKYFAILFLFCLGNSTDAFLLLRLNIAGLKTSWIPLCWALLHIVKMISSYFSNLLTERYGLRRTILLGWVLYAIIYFFFGYCTDLVAVLIAFMIYGLFYGFTEGPERALIGTLAPSAERGTIFGLYNLLSGMGLFLASLMFGAIWTEFGYQNAFYFGALLALISSILWLFAERNVKESTHLIS